MLFHAVRFMRSANQSQDEVQGTRKTLGAMEWEEEGSRVEPTRNQAGIQNPLRKCNGGSNPRIPEILGHAGFRPKLCLPFPLLSLPLSPLLQVNIGGNDEGRGDSLPSPPMIGGREPVPL